MEPMNQNQIIYYLAWSYRTDLEELIKYLEKDPSVSEERLGRVKENLHYLKNIENNMKLFK